MKLAVSQFHQMDEYESQQIDRGILMTAVPSKAKI